LARFLAPPRIGMPMPGRVGCGSATTGVFLAHRGLAPPDRGLGSPERRSTTSGN